MSIQNQLDLFGGFSESVSQNPLVSIFMHGTNCLIAIWRYTQFSDKAKLSTTLGVLRFVVYFDTLFVRI